MPEARLPRMRNLRILEDRTSRRVFFISAVMLGGINIATYPYIPRLGLVFYAWLVLAAVAGAGFWRGSSGPRYRWPLFAVFTLTVLGSRAIINMAGIATPKSAGSIGPLTVPQIWIGGIHLHHYMPGILLMAAAGAAIVLDYRSRRTSTVIFAVGLGLVVDELGIVVAGHTYHSPISYGAIAAVQLLLLALLLRDTRR